MELRTGDPYWAIRNGLLHSYPPVRSDQSAEVVVLGAGITGAKVAYRWGGAFASTADSLPIVGTLPEFPNTWFALGYGGNGITFSVMAAAIIRDAYRGLKHPAADLFTFDRPSR